MVQMEWNPQGPIRSFPVRLCALSDILTIAARSRLSAFRCQNALSVSGAQFRGGSSVSLATSSKANLATWHCHRDAIGWCPGCVHRPVTAQPHSQSCAAEVGKSVPGGASLAPDLGVRSDKPLLQVEEIALPEIPHRSPTGQ